MYTGKSTTRRAFPHKKLNRGFMLHLGKQKSQALPKINLIAKF
jgi:hypothetical protein